MDNDMGAGSPPTTNAEKKEQEWHCIGIAPMAIIPLAGTIICTLALLTAGNISVTLATKNILVLSATTLLLSSLFLYLIFVDIEKGEPLWPLFFLAQQVAMLTLTLLYRTSVLKPFATGMSLLGTMFVLPLIALPALCCYSLKNFVSHDK